MKDRYCIIMAGGKGERFWPLSTRCTPKPFIRLLGEKSLIRMTIDRLHGLVEKDHIFVVLGREHVDVARSQLPDFAADQFIVEPAGRDTAPCIGFAASILRRKDPNALMIVLPADHYIPDPDAFTRTMSRAVACAETGDYLVTTGIMPTRPETGYGYIHANEAMTVGGAACLRVMRFVEKPDEAKAVRYLAEGDYYWNAGMFVWRAAAVLDGIDRHIPELSGGLKEIGAACAAGDTQKMAAVFQTLPSISIDYGLMEKARNVVMVKAEFPWDDVGTWSALRRVMDLDEGGNYLRGKPVCVDTKGCVIYGDDIQVGAVGVSNLIIVASKEGVIVCDMDRDQEIRQVARMMDDKTST
jgi:mannose-1-phosphate guanylyltransferase